MHTFTKVGLDALLTPENCAVLLIDHQPSQLANVNSHEPTMVINNVTALAKTAKAYDVPTILTTINAKRGGEFFKQIQAVFPDQKPTARSFINSWEDRRVVEAVKSTGRDKLVIAALWSEMCLAQPAIHAMGGGYDVYDVPDASGGGTPGPPAGLWPLGRTRSQGWRWPENCSAIGRAQKSSEPWLRSCSIMPARPAPYWAGSWPTKHSARRTFHENDSHHRSDRLSRWRGRAGAAEQRAVSSVAFRRPVPSELTLREPKESCVKSESTTQSRRVSVRTLVADGLGATA